MADMTPYRNGEYDASLGCEYPEPVLPAYTEPTPMCQSDAPEIVSLAREVTRGIDPDDVRAMAKTLFYWVRDHIPYRLADWNDSAVVTATKLVGTCTTKCNLLVALCRSLGIPAGFHVMRVDIRRMYGPVMLDMFRPLIQASSDHFCAAVCLEGSWVRCDPSLDQPLVRAAQHIAPAVNVEFDGYRHGGPTLFDRAFLIYVSPLQPSIDDSLTKVSRIPEPIRQMLLRYTGFLRDNGHHYQRGEMARLSADYAAWLRQAHPDIMDGLPPPILAAIPQVSRQPVDRAAGWIEVMERYQRPAAPPESDESDERRVCSHNEWDPLEEVIVGRVEGASFPPWGLELKSTAPQASWYFLETNAARPMPDELLHAAHQDLDHLLRILDAAGVTVKRPEPIPQTRSTSSPHWSVESGYNLANPRDLLLVVGDQIIESPPAWRTRAFELDAYRGLLHDYFRAGARWIAAPRPSLRDEFYDQDYRVPGPDEPMRYAISESECTFDAADFTRCGRDLFVTRSNVTNGFGIEWVRRHLGDGYRVHEIETLSKQPMHIDTTFVPLAPGKALINPKYLDRSRLPAILSQWELREAPPPEVTPGTAVDLSSLWLTMNVVMLDERHPIVDSKQTALIAMLRQWGFDPVPCPFEGYFVCGGGFHCATLDVRRRGSLQSYFA